MGEFCRACRRRPNLAVGYAALWQGGIHTTRRALACRVIRTRRDLSHRMHPIAAVTFAPKNQIFSSKSLSTKVVLGSLQYLHKKSFLEVASMALVPALVRSRGVPWKKCPCQNAVFTNSKNCKILAQLCAESTFGAFWRACRRRPNLAVGYAALGQVGVHMTRRALVSSQFL